MYQIYTDGATSKNGFEGAEGGYAWAILKDGECVDYASYYIAPATNNICEMMAIITACEEIEHKLEPFDKVEVYSDSAYCINCYQQSWWKAWLHNNWINSKKEPVKNKELWEKLIPYFQDARFQFIKVKGHNGDKDQHSYWNERVDELAVAARKHTEMRVKYPND